MIEILGNKIILTRLYDDSLIMVNVSAVQVFQLSGSEGGKKTERAIINLENIPGTEITVKESFHEIKSAVTIVNQITDQEPGPMNIDFFKE